MKNKYVNVVNIVMVLHPMRQAKLAEAYEKGDHESQEQAKVRAQKMRG